MILNRGKLKKLVIGDYQLQFGQGLLHSGGFMLGKGGEVFTGVKRVNSGIRPYTSALETGFSRGVSATLKFGNLTFTPFVSAVGLNATVDILDTATGEEFAQSIKFSGLHRTTSELESRRSVGLRSGGANISYQAHKNLRVGMTNMFTQFQKPILKSDRLYNKFEFSGSNLWNTSFDFDYYFKGTNFFGEFAKSMHSGNAGIIGLLTNVSPKVDFAFSYRNFQANYHSFFSNAFGERTRNINEKGYFWALKYQINSKWSIQGFMDQFEFEQPTFQSSAPSRGHEYLARLKYIHNKQIHFYTQYRFKQKDENGKSDAFTLPIEAYSRHNYLVHAHFSVNKTITLKSRIQATNYSKASLSSSGIAFAQDIDFKIRRMTVIGRFSQFETDDWNSRQYMFERDVLYSFSVPVLYGSGQRYFLMLKYKPSSLFSFWLKYSRTKWNHITSNGSGNELIDLPTRSELKFQTIVNF